MEHLSPVLIVTGASSGIGAATARLFARQGYRVVLAARRSERLQALAGEIEAYGGTALPVATDVTQPEEIGHLVEAALERFGQIDVLFNNAGIGRLGWLEDLDPEEAVRKQVEVNLLGAIWTARAVLPHMIERRSGHIVNMGSGASFIATPTYSVYAATKFGMRGFTEALRREVGVYGIRVSGIYPGGVDTEFVEHTGMNRKTGFTTPRIIRLEAEEVAAAALHLVRRNRRSTVMPGVLNLAVGINRLFPGLVDWIIERWFVRPERGA